MSKPTFVNPGPAPSRTMPEEEFESTSNSFFGKIPSFADSMQESIDWIDSTFTATDQARQQAAQSAEAAGTSEQNAAESEQAAEGYKNTAETAAAAAQSAAGLPSLAGNANKKLGVTDDESGVGWVNDAGVISVYEEITESSLFSKDTNATWVYVEVLGAGQAGAGGGGQAGESGGFASKLYRATDLPESASVVIGYGGVGTTSAASGEVGGDSSFNGDLIAYGGGNGFPISSFEVPPAVVQTSGVGTGGVWQRGSSGGAANYEGGANTQALAGGGEGGVAGATGTDGADDYNPARTGGAGEPGSDAEAGGPYQGGGGGGNGGRGGRGGNADPVTVGVGGTGGTGGNGGAGGDGGIASGGGAGGAGGAGGSGGSGANGRPAGSQGAAGDPGKGGDGGDGIARIWQW